MTTAHFGKSVATSTGTVIGPGLVIEGEITGDEPLTIEGDVKGSVVITDAVSVSGSATVEAAVQARTLRVGGALVGNVAASERVEVTSEGRLTGDVRAPRVSIADGATFKGHIDMNAEEPENHDT